jgi:hypothetical protein
MCSPLCLANNNHASGIPLLSSGKINVRGLVGNINCFLAVIKELIQNAEDAGATEVKFLYDDNSYPTDSLHHPDLAKYQV